jgi:RNA polymerase sigma-70 factor (ECF subfamily)
MRTVPLAPELIQQFVRDRGHILGFLRVLCRDADLAEELFQELSVVVMEKARAFDRSRDFGAWVRGIARNLHRRARERGRRGRLQPARDPELVEAVLAAYDDRSDPEASEKAEDVGRLKHCLDQLPDPHRRLMADRYELGLPSARIAELHHRTVSAVETALCRLRTALLECVRRRAEAES